MAYTFFFALKSLALLLLFVGGDPSPVLPPNIVLALDGVYQWVGTGQNCARVHHYVNSDGDLEPELWDLLFYYHAWLM